jgi:hypothetical protein
MAYHRTARGRSPRDGKQRPETGKNPLRAFFGLGWTWNDGSRTDDTIASDVKQDKVNGNQGKNTLLRTAATAVTKSKAKRIRFVINDFLG